VAAALAGRGGGDGCRWQRIGPRLAAVLHDAGARAGAAGGGGTSQGNSDGGVESGWEERLEGSGSRTQGSEIGSVTFFTIERTPINVALAVVESGPA
jgi:hypothetical protein